MSLSKRLNLNSKLDTLSDCSFVRLGTLVKEQLIPFSTSTLWRKCKNHTFPSPVKISNGVTAWRLGDLREWSKDPLAYNGHKKGGSK